MADAGILTLAIVLLLLPLALLRDLFRLNRRWRLVPLPQKNLTRATGGAFVLTLCAVLAAGGFPYLDPKVMGGIAVFALLHLLVGMHGARFDVMSVFWWLVVVLGCAALFTFKDFLL
jgi:hypothetical protein